MEKNIRHEWLRFSVEMDLRVGQYFLMFNVHYNTDIAQGGMMQMNLQQSIFAFYIIPESLLFQVYTMLRPSSVAFWIRSVW